MTYKRILLETEGREISLEEIILQNQDELEEIRYKRKDLKKHTKLKSNILMKEKKI